MHYISLFLFSKYNITYETINWGGFFDMARPCYIHQLFIILQHKINVIQKSITFIFR